MLCLGLFFTAGFLGFFFWFGGNLITGFKGMPNSQDPMTGQMVGEFDLSCMFVPFVILSMVLGFLLAGWICQGMGV